MLVKITVDYDTKHQTWNVMQGNKCIFYGDIMSVEKWLVDNKDRYSEDD